MLIGRELPSYVQHQQGRRTKSTKCEEFKLLKRVKAFK